MVKNLVAMLREAVDMIHANPAASAMIASVVAALAGKFGFHMSTAALATQLTVVNVLLFAWVHGKVTPVAKLEAAKRN